MALVFRGARGLWLAIVLLSAWCAASLTQADAARREALDLTELAGGVSPSSVAYVLEDPAGTLGLEDVLRPERQRAFRRIETEGSLGFTRSAFWLRFDVLNPKFEQQHWLLELAYPHLDQIDLFASADGGPYQHKQAGDTLPFSAREVDHPNFVFSEDSPAHSRTRFYLRVRTSGSLRVPLRAWTAIDFVRHENRQNLILWMFYGVVFVMICFDLGVAILLRSREHLMQVGLLLSIGAAIFTLSGQTYQYILSDYPLLENRALSVSMALGLLFVQLYTRQIGVQYEQLKYVLRVYHFSMPLSVLALLAALLLPTPWAQPIVFAAITLYMPFGLYKLQLARRASFGALRFYVASLSCLAIGIPIALLAHSKLIPPWPLAIWAGHLGCAGYALLDALALPARITDMKDRLAALNEQLSDNVRTLEAALVDSKQANDEARRATKAKDEFMATMSHELRTPLNAIINVPQGLLDDFAVLRAATCRACQARFVLDDEDTIDSQTECLACHARGSLVEGSKVEYSGDPAHTMRFLRKIERSGHHLLQMVNGVLDFSKMQAGHLELVLERVSLEMLLTEALEAMSDLSASKGITLELKLPPRREASMGDAVRIRQVLLNLLSNALKFSEPGGKVELSWLRDVEHDTISVRDHGIGIAPADHERVFASFEQVHKGDTRKYGGTGLGLSISRSLVRMHGGELWVESALGQGAEFKFTLPRALAGLNSAEHSLSKSA